MSADPELDALTRDVDGCCRLSGEFTLRSGLVASEYFDKYRFEADPALLARVIARMVPLLPPETEVLGGLELGGVPLATLIGQRTGLAVLFVRKAAKDYGTRQLAEGGNPTGRRVTLIEDVITTGGAVRNAATALRALGATVDTVVCAIDREQIGGNPLADDGIEMRAVLTRSRLDASRAAPPPV